MNTKLEVLNSYSNRRIRDTWAALGSLQASDSSKYYLKEMIYQINEPTSALNGYLVFCNESVSGSAPWTLATYVDDQYGEISFQTDIVDPRFTAVLTEPELVAIAEPVDTEFEPFSVSDNIASILIPDEELDLVLREIGVPFISYDELEYGKQDIINLAIKPALEEYFKWFPKVRVDSFPISSSAKKEIPFPDDAYDIVHIGINQGVTGSGVSNTLLRYFDEVIWMAGSPAASGGFGGRRRPSTKHTDWGGMMLDRAGRQAVINYGTRIHHDIFRDAEGKKILRVSSNKMGTMEVHFAMKSGTWLDAEFARLPELRNLARANALTLFGSIRSQAKSDIPGTVDYKDWVNKGEDLREKVLADWKELVKFAGIIRGSH